MLIHKWLCQLVIFTIFTNYISFPTIYLSSDCNLCLKNWKVLRQRKCVYVITFFAKRKSLQINKTINFVIICRLLKISLTRGSSCLASIIGKEFFRRHTMEARVLVKSHFEQFFQKLSVKNLTIQFLLNRKLSIWANSGQFWPTLGD